MHKFGQQSVDEKLLFLFKIYDLNDDGLIQISELYNVIEALHRLAICDRAEKREKCAVNHH